MGETFMGKMGKDKTQKGEPGKGSPKRPDRREEDAALWKQITETVAPLKKRDLRVVQEPRKPVRPQSRKGGSPEDAAGPAPTPAQRRSAQAPFLPPAPAPVTLDRGTARKLEKGRLPVEARLDLHGMRQRHAHSALRRFLFDAQAQGLRHVLVITGKGTTKAVSENFYMEEPRGVLRQQVPGWLTQTDLAPVVVSFSEAPQRLGGAGALYVRLRKPR